MDIIVEKINTKKKRAKVLINGSPKYISFKRLKEMQDRPEPIPEPEVEYLSLRTPDDLPSVLTAEQYKNLLISQKNDFVVITGEPKEEPKRGRPKKKKEQV